MSINVVTEHTGVSTLAGTPKEVRAQLSKSHADRALVVTFENIQQNDFESLTQNLIQVTSSMLEALQEQHEKVMLERLAETLVPRQPPSPKLLREAAMLVKARKAVFESGDWLTAADVAQLAGLSTRNPSAQPNKWKKRGLIFAINHGGIDYFPGYGLDRHTEFRPIKELADIIKIFDDHKDAWGMAYWFRSDNSFLGGKRPQDLLASSPDRVIEAARDEIEGIVHG